MRRKIRKIYNYLNVWYFKQSPFLWFYSAFLTLRYVNEWKTFPAIFFNGSISLRIIKGKNAQLIIKDKLILEEWINGNGKTVITLDTNSLMLVEREFVLGDGIKVKLAPSSSLILKGKNIGSASGITANSVILVKEYLEIGKDCIIAWDTFLTDCDWHSITGKVPVYPTIIGDHVWIGVGAKILKGAKIGDNSIIAPNSVVLKGVYTERVLISGVPAKVIKEGIPNWSRDM